MTDFSNRGRKLASIQRIHALSPIPGADAIVVARVLNWTVVVRKGDYSVGDLCVYCEIDSVLPEPKEFEFLAKVGFRIRTIRLRCQISQGICFPLSILDEFELDSSIQEGLEVTSILGVEKYDPPIPVSLTGKARGPFPSWLVKTDEIRIQSTENVVVDGSPVNGVLHRHVGERVYTSEKLDGTSLTAWLKDGEFGVSSRNLDLLETPENTLWQVVRKLKVEERMREDGRNLALQGELIGPDIQKNRYGLTEVDIRFFNVFMIDEHRWMDRDEFVETIHRFGLKTVPILEDFNLAHTVEDLVEMADGPSVLLPSQAREGLVVRPLVESTDPEFGRFSFKVISPAFLLGGGEA